MTNFDPNRISQAQKNFSVVQAKPRLSLEQRDVRDVRQTTVTLNSNCKQMAAHQRDGEDFT